MVSENNTERKAFSRVGTLSEGFRRYKLKTLRRMNFFRELSVFAITDLGLQLEGEVTCYRCFLNNCLILS